MTTSEKTEFRLGNLEKHMEHATKSRHDLKNKMTLQIAKTEAIEEQVDSIDKSVTEIKDNHLFHIDMKITKLDINQKWVMLIGGFIITETTVILIKQFL